MPEEILETPQPTQSTEPKPTNWPKIILAAVLGFGLLAGAAYAGYWYGTQQAQKADLPIPYPLEIPEATPSPQPTGGTPPKTAKETVDQIILSVNESDEFGYKFLYPPKEGESLWWVSEDGWNILDDTGHYSEVSVPTTWDGPSPNSLHSYSRTIHSFVSQFLIQNGFTKNIVNSSDSEEDRKYYDYISAFQKGNIRCTLTTNNDRSAQPQDRERPTFEISFVCSENFQDKYSQQVPFLEALSDYNESKFDGVLSSLIASGDAFKIQIHWRRTGAYAIGKVINGKHTVLYFGQATPLCNLMQEYNIPKGIYTGCE